MEIPGATLSLAALTAEQYSLFVWMRANLPKRLAINTWTQLRLEEFLIEYLNRRLLWKKTQTF